jgi:GntR family transcriptional regulator
MQKNSGIPLYIQIKDWINSEIQSGRLAEGERIPGEYDLCQALNVSRGTVREAIRELIEEGVLYTIHGRGTYVREAEPVSWSVNTIVSVADSFDRANIEHSTALLEIQKTIADSNVAAQLQIDPRAEVIRLERLRFIKDEPVHLSLSYLPASISEKLLEIDLTDRSLYQIMEQELGVRVARVDRRIMARIADRHETELLQLPTVSAVLVLNGIAYNAFDKPLECSIARFPTDRSRFVIQSKRLN